MTDSTPTTVLPDVTQATMPTVTVVFYPRCSDLEGESRRDPWSRAFTDMTQWERVKPSLLGSYEKIVVSATNQTVWFTATEYQSGLTITGVCDVRRSPERKHLWEGVCNFPQNRQVSAEVVRYIDVFGDGKRVWWLF